MHIVHSQSIIKSAMQIDYTSTLETLEGLPNALARHCACHVGAWEILHAFIKVRESQKLYMVMNKAPCSLYFDSEMWQINA